MGSIRPAGVMARACRHRRPQATREAPAVIVIHKDQLATRERQAGPCGVTERPIVPTKPVTPVEGRDLSSRPTQAATKDTGIDDESSHPAVVLRRCRRRYMPTFGSVCVFSESRMREIRLSGSMSGKRKQN